MRLLALAALVAPLAACGNADAAQQTQTPTQSAPFVQHPDHIQPGLTLSARYASLVNPFDGNAQRSTEGGKLFINYNCLDCHGAEGSGAMGPSLQDSRWHFGGSNAGKKWCRHP